MKTITIKGKEYVPVVERIKEFHKQYPKGQIQTKIESNDGKRIIVKAEVFIYVSNDGGGNLYRQFTGYSQAEWGKGMMGGVALEVAETSAVGRALGFANIGLLDGIATADEMRKTHKVVNNELLDKDLPPF